VKRKKYDDITRMAAAMRVNKPDRVPILCQPSWGVVLQELPGLDPINFWHNHDGAMAPAFWEISRRFGFDGVMIPAVGAAPLDEIQVARIDRLEFIIDAGFDGIECLDPPPLGKVELGDVVRRIGGRAFIKGNIDPISVLLNGTPDQIRADIQQRLAIGKPAGGFILSTACTIAPSTPAAHVALLCEVVGSDGWY
jgi:hypothetical protein